MKSFGIFSSFFVVASISSLISQVSGEKVITPFGIRPKECVHHLPSGHRLRPTDEGVEVIESTYERVVAFHPRLDLCMEDMKNIAPLNRRKNSTFPINGWLDYVSYTPSANVQDFSATYQVPSDPSRVTNQVLFYFIGVENFDSNAVTILQPVLTWGNGNSGWNMASWNCCPSGQTWTSDFLLNLEAGQILKGYISVNDTISTIISEDSNGNKVTLEVETNGRNFNWMDVTLEVYSVSNCKQLATSSMTISDMVATDVDGSQINMEWADATGSTACNGAQVFSQTSWTDTHSA